MAPARRRAPFRSRAPRRSSPPSPRSRRRLVLRQRVGTVRVGHLSSRARRPASNCAGLGGQPRTWKSTGTTDPCRRRRRPHSCRRRRRRPWRSRRPRPPISAPASRRRCAPAPRACSASPARSPATHRRGAARRRSAGRTVRDRRRRCRARGFPARSHCTSRRRHGGSRDCDRGSPSRRASTSPRARRVGVVHARRRFSQRPFAVPRSALRRMIP